MIIVNYRPDPKLDMLVPATTHEVDLATDPASEHIECDAHYSDSRQFETAARLVPNR